MTSLDVSDHEILVGSGDKNVRCYDLRMGSVGMHILLQRCLSVLFFLSRLIHIWYLLFFSDGLCRWHGFLCPLHARRSVHSRGRSQQEPHEISVFICEWKFIKEENEKIASKLGKGLKFASFWDIWKAAREKNRKWRFWGKMRKGKGKKEENCIFLGYKLYCRGGVS